MRPRHLGWRTRGLVYLVLLTALIGVAGNPAASIALIPRLDWWRGQDYFFYMDSNGRTHSLSDAGFSMFIPKNVFPPTVNVSSLYGKTRLAGTSNCLSSSDQERLDAFNDPRHWMKTSVSQYLEASRSLQDQLYILLNSSLESDHSRLITVMGHGISPSLSGPAFQTDTATSNSAISQYLNRSFQASPDGTIDGSWTLEANIPGDILKAPHTAIGCEVMPTSSTQRNLSSIYEYYGGSNPFLDRPIDVSSFWNKSMLYNPKQTKFEWVELSQIENETAGFILQPPSKYGGANVTICLARAVWYLTSIWTLPDGTEDFTGQKSASFTFNNAFDCLPLSGNTSIG